MRQSQSAVIERGAELESVLETEPFETAWAGEARWFVQHVGGDGTATYVTQVSPDGLTWCDLDEVEHVVGPGRLVSWPATGFGPVAIGGMGCFGVPCSRGSPGFFSPTSWESGCGSAR